jgi:hypothetical protein
MKKPILAILLLGSCALLALSVPDKAAATCLSACSISGCRTVCRGAAPAPRIVTPRRIAPSQPALTRNPVFLPQHQTPIAPPPPQSAVISNVPSPPRLTSPAETVAGKPDLTRLPAPPPAAMKIGPAPGTTGAAAPASSMVKSASPDHQMLRPEPRLLPSPNSQPSAASATSQMPHPEPRPFPASPVTAPKAPTILPSSMATGASTTGNGGVQDASYLLTGGTGQQQCATCTAGGLYNHISPACPTCVYKFVPTPGCGSSCWVPVSASSGSASNPSGIASPGGQPVSTQGGQPPSSWTVPTDAGSYSSSENHGPVARPPRASTHSVPAVSSQASANDTGPNFAGNNSDSLGDDRAANSNQQATAVAEGVPTSEASLDALEQNVSTSVENALNQYQQNSEEFVDDVNQAIDTFEQVSKFKEGVDAYKKGDLDNYVVNNLATAAYQGMTDAAIDNAIPRTGDPLQNSLNDFSKALSRLPQTGPTISDAINRVKTAFQTTTGTVKGNLDCLKKMIMLEANDCTNQ